MGKIEGWGGETWTHTNATSWSEIQSQRGVCSVSVVSVTTPQLREASMATPNQLEVQDYNTAEVYGYVRTYTYIRTYVRMVSERVHSKERRYARR